jgi:hypothetical protein
VVENRARFGLPEADAVPAFGSKNNMLRRVKLEICELDSGLIFDGCGLMACFSLRPTSSDGAFSRHPKSKLTRFRDMADHNIARKPRVHFRPKPEGNRINSFSEQ